MKTVILCYHKIGSETEEGRFLNCPPERLESHARYFRRKGWDGFLPRHYQSQRPHGICFTFDDAYVSAVDQAPAILERYQYRGAFYVVPSLVGKASEWDGEVARPLATWEAVLPLTERGHEVGNHSMSHPHFADLDQGAQENELRMADAELQKRGVHAASFAFPYGSHNKDTLRAMEATGIAVGLALGKRPVLDEKSNCLPRIVVGYSDAVVKLLYKIFVRPKLP